MHHVQDSIWDETNISNDIVINERRTALAPDQVDNILFIRSVENMKFAQ
jgi:hypothetical protein